MTAYEIISIFIGISALLMSFGSLIVALLAFFDKRNRVRESFSVNSFFGYSMIEYKIMGGLISCQEQM